MNYSNDQLKDMFCEKMNRISSENKRPVLWIGGLVGSGKSSLIRLIFADLKPDQQTGSADWKDPAEADDPGSFLFENNVKYENGNIVVRELSFPCGSKSFSRTFEKEAEKTLETDTDQNKSELKGNDKRTLSSREQMPDPFDGGNGSAEKPDLFWYTVDGSRFDAFTDNWGPLENYRSMTAETVVVVTHRDLMRPSQLEAIRTGLENRGIHCGIVAVSDKENGSVGAADLVRLSLEKLQEDFRTAFQTAQTVDREIKIQAVYDKAATARKIIAAASAAAGGIGLIPIPLSDAALLVPTQLGMIAGLAALYQFQDRITSSLILPFVGECAGLVTASSLTKLIPGLGSLVNAGVAGGITAVMGKFVQNSFEEIAVKSIKGEPVPEIGFSFDKFKNFYEDHIKKGAKDE